MPAVAALEALAVAYGLTRAGQLRVLVLDVIGLGGDAGAEAGLDWVSMSPADAAVQMEAALAERRRRTSGGKSGAVGDLLARLAEHPGVVISAVDAKDHSEIRIGSHLDGAPVTWTLRRGWSTPSDIDGK